MSVTWDRFVKANNKKNDNTHNNLKKYIQIYNRTFSCIYMSYNSCSSTFTYKRYINVVNIYTQPKSGKYNSKTNICAFTQFFLTSKYNKKFNKIVVVINKPPSSVRTRIHPWHIVFTSYLLFVIWLYLRFVNNRNTICRPIVGVKQLFETTSNVLWFEDMSIAKRSSC